MKPPHRPSLLWAILVPLILIVLIILIAYFNPPPRPAPVSTNWADLGKQAFDSGDFQLAITLLNQAAAEQKLAPDGWLMLGDAYSSTYDLVTALQAWQNAGDTLESLKRRSGVHTWLGDYQAAITDLKAMLAIQPENADYQYLLGLLLAVTHPERAIPYLEKAADLDPPALQEVALTLAHRIQAALPVGNSAYTLLEAGRGLMDNHQWELAAEAFRNASELSPNYAEAWAFLGEALQHLDAPVGKSFSPDGLPELERALQIDPGSLSANLFLALYLRRQGELSKAQDILELLANGNSNNAPVQIELGNVLAENGNFKSALSHFTLAAELAPDEANSWLALSSFSISSQYQVRQVGLPAARQLLLLTPGDPQALDLMGQALLLLDDPLSAEKFIRQAIDINPKYAPAHLHLAQVYLGRSASVAARQELDITISLAPGSIEASYAQRLLDNLAP